MRTLALSGAEPAQSADPLPGRPEARALIEAQARVLGFEPPDLATLPEVTPGELPWLIRGPETRRHAVWLLSLTALADRSPTLAQARFVEAACDHLRVQEPVTRVVRLLARGRRAAARNAVLRRLPMTRWMRREVRRRGPLGALRILRTLGGRYQNRAMAERYQSWRRLPPGTLGRAHADFIEARGLSFPGEPGGPLEGIIVHDLEHLLSGYGTTPGEEFEVACFTAGHMDRDAFAMVLSVFFHFHLGIQVYPGEAPPAERFDLERAVRAMRRARAVWPDISTFWDFPAFVGRPLADVRDRLSIPPPDRPVDPARAAAPSAQPASPTV